jgi:hypothetical protein
MTDVDQLRRLPATPDAQDHCVRCRRPIVWAVMAASPTTRAGARVPLDPYEAADGNRAVRPVIGGRLVARSLGKDEDLDGPWEFRAIVHFATCPNNPTDANPRLPEEVVDLAAARARRNTTGAPNR